MKVPLPLQKNRIIWPKLLCQNVVESPPIADLLIMSRVLDCFDGNGAPNVGQHSGGRVICNMQ